MVLQSDVEGAREEPADVAAMADKAGCRNQKEKSFRQRKEKLPRSERSPLLGRARSGRALPCFLPPTARGVDEAACLPACQSARGKRHCASLSLGAEKQPRTDGRTDGVSGSKRERKGCGGGGGGGGGGSAAAALKGRRAPCSHACPRGGRPN